MLGRHKMNKTYHKNAAQLHMRMNHQKIQICTDIFLLFYHNPKNVPDCIGIGRSLVRIETLDNLKSNKTLKGLTVT